MKLLLTTVFFSSLMFVGCSPSSSNASSGTLTNEEARATLQKMYDAVSTDDPASFTGDLVGQVKRVMAEGTDDAHVQQNLTAADRTVTYEMLKKNADKYAGRPWVFTGKILEISEDHGGTTARISLDDWGNKPIYVAGPLETDFVEKNRVTVVGYLAGNYSYTSQANWNITIPAVAARAIIKPIGKK